jgi:hypothetical protein
MKILDRLPIPQADTPAHVGTESVLLKKDQIIVWISLTEEKAARWNPTRVRFPAILDTGHTHNFAIQHQHLVRWIGIQPAMLRQLGHIRHGGKRMPLYAANLWLHGNRPGEMDLLPDNPFFLKLVNGIAVYPDGVDYPRLPLLGLRAILSNRLHFAVDGERASVTLRTPDWRTWLISRVA